EDVLALQHLVRRIPVTKPLVRAAVTLVRMTRAPDAESPAFIKEFVAWGAGPRASQYLILGAKARAALDGRPMPDYDDLKGVAPTPGSSPTTRVPTPTSAAATATSTSRSCPTASAGSTSRVSTTSRRSRWTGASYTRRASPAWSTVAR